MKRFLALILALVMVLSLVACGGAEKAPETEAPKAEAAAPAPEAEAAPAAPAVKLHIPTSTWK